MKLKRSIFILISVLAVFSFMWVSFKKQPKVNKANATLSGQVISVPLDDRRGHEAYMVEGQPGKEDVSWIEWFNGSFFYNRYDINTKQEVKRNLDLPKSGYYSGNVYAFQNNNTVWMGAGNSIVKINSNNGDSKIIKIPNSANIIPSQLPSTIQADQPINGMEIDSNGHLWITRETVSSLIEYSAETGFKEHKSPSDLIQPEKPAATEEGIVVMDAKRNSSEFESPTSQVFGSDGIWRKPELPGLLMKSNQFGTVYAKDMNGLIAIKKATKSETANINIKNFPKLFLNNGKDNTLWYDGDGGTIIKYDMSSGDKKDFKVPMDDIKEMPIGTAFGDASADIKIGPVFDNSVVAQDGSFWTACMIRGQLLIVGVVSSVNP